MLGEEPEFISSQLYGRFRILGRSVDYPARALRQPLVVSLRQPVTQRQCGHVAYGADPPGVTAVEDDNHLAGRDGRDRRRKRIARDRGLRQNIGGGGVSLDGNEVLTGARTGLDTRPMP